MTERTKAAGTFNVKIIPDGNVVSARGYSVNSLRVGIKPSASKSDMAMIVSEKAATYVGTFTRNLVKAAPVERDSKIMNEKGIAEAVVINTGIANAATGKTGLEACEKTAAAAGKALGILPERILTASTGVIGMQLPVEKLENGAAELAKNLKKDSESAHKAANAILTTDTHSKEIAVEFTIGKKTCIIGAMCKGSGMIHPNMGTMLGFLMSDVAIEHDIALKALRSVVDKTFNMVSVDGDTSTNDTVILMCNGMAGNVKITEENEDYEIFKEALTVVAEYLAKNIAKDGEGATRLFTANVKGAKDYETAKILAKSIITSNLSKAAIFGKDANCGRLFCAMGYSGADFKPEKTDIWIESVNGSIKLVENGAVMEFSEEKALEILSPDEITAVCDVKDGNFEAVAWGCDLTYDYVKINADYRS